MNEGQHRNCSLGLDSNWRQFGHGEPLQPKPSHSLEFRAAHKKRDQRRSWPKSSSSFEKQEIIIGRFSNPAPAQSLVRQSADMRRRISRQRDQFRKRANTLQTERQQIIWWVNSDLLLPF